MAKAGRILYLIGGILSAMLGLVFIVVEGRLLCSGELSLYAHPLLGYFTTACRLLAAVAVLAAGVAEILYFAKKDSQPLRIYAWVSACLLFFAGVFLINETRSGAGLASFYLSIPLYLFGSLQALAGLLDFFGKKAPVSDSSAK